MIIVGNGAYSQILPSHKGNQLPILTILRYNSPTIFSKLHLISKPAYKPFLRADFYSQQLGFFCKQEIKMDKALKIPFRFRLGSVEQCNWLEGKRR
jgi:hypothetical protein